MRPYRHLLGVRPFRLLIGGQAISTAGDMLYAVALPWLVLGHGGTAQALSAVLAAYSVPRVATVLLGGWLSDRLGPRRVMLLADAARAALVALLAGLALHGVPALWALCAVAAPLGACEGVFLPASFAIMPTILTATDLPAGNALNATTVQLANLLGPALGGLVVARLSAAPALAADAVTFVVSALALSAMGGPTPSPPVASREPCSPSADGEGRNGRRDAARPYKAVKDESRLYTAMRNESLETRRSLSKTDHPLSIADGEGAGGWGRLRHLVRTWRLLQVALVIVIVGNLTIGGMMFVALPALAHGPLHAGAGGYGALLAAFGGGALVGGLLAGAAGRLPRPAVVILGLTLVQATGVAALPFAGGVAGAAAVLAVAGLATGITNVLYLTLVQRTAPPDLLGQIMGVFAFATLGLYPVSVALAGVVATRWGPAAMFPLTGLAIACAVCYGLAQREIREMEA